MTSVLSAGTMSSVVSGAGDLHMAFTSAASVAGGGSSSVASAAHHAIMSNVLATAAGGGDSHYWEESISPSTIRKELADVDPTDVHATPTLLRACKWLLAQVSKGRDVSDFFPLVVKCVNAQSYQVRKLVYLFLERFANATAETRQLSLLSINAFQRGLADAEPLIRAMALRVMSALDVPDILQIQWLAVQTCSTDKSPYVRKCAAMAMVKVHHKLLLQEENNSSLETASTFREDLLILLEQWTRTETQTMVLTSCMVAWSTVCPERLDLLHGCYRKLCHLLTDMDEWGQVVVMEGLSRYCRTYFRAPSSSSSSGRTNSTTNDAEVIDAQRRVTRSILEQVRAGVLDGGGGGDPTMDFSGTIAAMTNASGGVVGNSISTIKKVKRRVVQKGFYSDDEDESTEEEVWVGGATNVGGGAGGASLSAALRQPTMGGGGGITAGGTMGGGGATTNTTDAPDYSGLAEDHKLLLTSSLPLLKSRNSAVVLAVCSLHYHCGTSGSIRIRSALGKALTRIHRDKRELQYVVLTSIQALAKVCPSAFQYRDFFIQLSLDPPFTKMAKLDILISLALEPNSLRGVLEELRHYVRFRDDWTFCRASLHAVGILAGERARFVHDRHAQQQQQQHSEHYNVRKTERQSANTMALNAMYGLWVSSRTMEVDTAVLGEIVIVMVRMLVLLQQDTEVCPVSDPNHIQAKCLGHIMVLVMLGLKQKWKDMQGTTGNDEEEEEEEDEDQQGKPHTVFKLPSRGFSAGLWIVGEWLTSSDGWIEMKSFHNNNNKSKARTQILQLLASSYTALHPMEKLQAIHFATKVLAMSSSSSKQTNQNAEFILSLGRVDVNVDVRDVARCSSNLLQASVVGLQYDVENISSSASTIPASHNKLSRGTLQSMLLSNKPPSCSLPFNDDDQHQAFRFGTLSSLVHYKAGDSYIPLPEWATKNSDATLRDPPNKHRGGSSAPKGDDGWADSSNTRRNFYEEEDEGDDSEDDSSSESDESESDSDDDADDEEEDSDDDDDDEDDSDDEDNLLGLSAKAKPSAVQQIMAPKPSVSLMDDDDDDDESESDDDDDDDDDDSSDEEEEESDEDDYLPTPSKKQNKKPAPTEGSLLSMMPTGVAAAPAKPTSAATSSYSSSLEGLVMAPVAVDDDEDGMKKRDPDLERDSSVWSSLVKPELAGGLSVMARYLRGPTKFREANLMGLDGTLPTTVILQLKIENKRTDAGVLRRVRVVPRATSSSSAIGPRITKPPLEILALKKGQAVTGILGIDFKSSSDKEGVLCARFDLKSDRGSNSVELKPSLAELLLSSKTKTKKPTEKEFDAAMAQLQGFQRVSTMLPKEGASLDMVSSIVLKHSAMHQIVSKDKKKDKVVRSIGYLPLSLDPIYMTVAVPSMKLTVCCDHPIATNSLLGTFKKAFASTK